MPSFNVGDILAVLSGRSEPDTFHWTICVPLSAKVAAKYHAKQSADHWWFEYSEESGIPEEVVTSSLLSVGLKIGSLDPATVHKEVLTQYLRPIALSVPVVDQAREPKFTCRVWFREAIRVLHKAGVLQCNDIDGLEMECKKYGMANQPAFPSYRGYLSYVSEYSV